MSGGVIQIDTTISGDPTCSLSLSGDYNAYYTGLLFNASLFSVSCAANPGGSSVCEQRCTTLSFKNASITGTFSSNCNSYTDNFGDVWNKGSHSAAGQLVGVVSILTLCVGCVLALLQVLF